MIKFSPPTLLILKTEAQFSFTLLLLTLLTVSDEELKMNYLIELWV